MNRKITLLILPALFILSLSAFAQFRKTTETVGVNFQWHRFSSDGAETDYYALAIPLRAVYAPGRYTSFSFFLNQGYQSYAQTGLYGLGNLAVEFRQMFNENFTLQLQAVAPTGTQELERLELNAASAGKIPYINAPSTYANQGLGFKGGLAFAQQAGEGFKIGLGASYTYRGSYRPVKDGGEFDPSDEILLAAGVEIGSEQGGIIADFRYAFYNPEKAEIEENAGKEEISTPGDAISLSGQIFLSSLQLSVLYYDRVATQFPAGGEFKSPAVLTVRLANRFGNSVFVPYLGYEYNDEGDLILSANVLLVGGYFHNFTPGGFPFSPYLEVKYGEVAPGASMLGFRVGTSLAFQLYN